MGKKDSLSSKSRLEMVNEFWASPDQALFTQETLSAVTGLSHSFFERARWIGDGPNFIKLSRVVRYKKSEVIAWMEQWEHLHKLP